MRWALLLLLLALFSTCAAALDLATIPASTESHEYIFVNDSFSGGNVYGVKFAAIVPGTPPAARFELTERGVLKAIITIPEGSAQTDPSTGVQISVNWIKPEVNQAKIDAYFYKSKPAEGVTLYLNSSFTADSYKVVLTGLFDGATRAQYHIWFGDQLSSIVNLTDGEEWVDPIGVRLHQYYGGYGMMPGTGYAAVDVTFPIPQYQDRGKYQLNVEQWFVRYGYGFQLRDINATDGVVSYKFDIWHLGKLQETVTVPANAMFTAPVTGVNITTYNARYYADVDIDVPLAYTRVGTLLHIGGKACGGDYCIELQDVRDSYQNNGWPNRAYFIIYTKGQAGNLLPVNEGSWDIDLPSRVRIYVFRTQSININDTYADIATDFPGTPQAGHFNPPIPGEVVPTIQAVLNISTTTAPTATPAPTVTPVPTAYPTAPIVTPRPTAVPTRVVTVPGPDWGPYALAAIAAIIIVVLIWLIAAARGLERIPPEAPIPPKPYRAPRTRKRTRKR